MELDDIVQRLYYALTVLEQSMGYVAPYVPTPHYVVKHIIQLLAWLSAQVSTGRQPRLLEAGCGDGRVAAAIAEEGVYTICLELDENLVRKAHLRLSNLLGDTVEADLRRLPLRPAFDTVYAYLLPEGVQHVLSQRPSKLLVSLDYYAPNSPPKHAVTVDHHYVYIYVLDVNVNLEAILKNNSPEFFDRPDNP